MTGLRFERLTGEAVVPYLPALAFLRITVFREYPYLYDGTLDYELHYLQVYVASPGSLVVLAFDGDEPVGATTGLPMVAADPEFAEPFISAGLDITHFFYCGESLLLPAYRGRGVGHHFFDEREAHACVLGLAQSAFCAVERPPDHPLRPADYIPHDAFWTKRGYTRRPDLVAHYAWRDIDQPTETSKPMVFWVKTLTT